MSSQKGLTFVGKVLNWKVDMEYSENITVVKLLKRCDEIEDALFELWYEIFDIEPSPGRNRYFDLEYPDEYAISENGFFPDKMLEIWHVLFEPGDFFD